MDFQSRTQRFALMYLAQRFVFRIRDFFHHWYVDISHMFFRVYRSHVRNIEKSLAFSVTIKHLFEPLYKDYSIVGRLIGPFFRLGRLGLGGVIYLFITLLFLAVYGAWVLFPIGMIVYTIMLSFHLL